MILLRRVLLIVTGFVSLVSAVPVLAQTLYRPDFEARKRWNYSAIEDKFTGQFLAQATSPTEGATIPITFLCSDKKSLKLVLFGSRPFEDAQRNLQARILFRFYPHYEITIRIVPEEIDTRRAAVSTAVDDGKVLEIMNILKDDRESFVIDLNGLQETVWLRNAGPPLRQLEEACGLPGATVTTKSLKQGCEAAMVSSLLLSTLTTGACAGLQLSHRGTTELLVAQQTVALSNRGEFPLACTLNASKLYDDTLRTYEPQIDKHRGTDMFGRHLCRAARAYLDTLRAQYPGDAFYSAQPQN